MLWTELQPGDVLHNSDVIPNTRSSLLILSIDTLQGRGHFTHAVRYVYSIDGVCHYGWHETPASNIIKGWTLIRAGG